MGTILNVGLILLMTSCCLCTLVSYSVPGSTDDGEITSVDIPLSSEQVNDILTPGSYSHHVQLDDNYSLQWKFNSTHIIFHSHVKTNGYVGLGISDNGAMYPSDVIIAWVKDGHVHCADRHATGQYMPVVDTHQDWDLISATEQGDYTTITVIRKLDTCDDEDFPIETGTTKLIYSYSSSDPPTEDNIGYHGDTRGTKSVLLLDPPTTDNPLPEDTFTLGILATNYSVPASETTYFCKVWKSPPLDGKHHLIRYDPLVQKGHERLVHHMVVYVCPRDFDDSLVGSQYNCRRDAPGDINTCLKVFIGWAAGGSAFIFPENVGISMGTPGDPVYLKMEIHYNNFNMRAGIVDNSGIRMYLTKQLRQHDVGLFDTGVHVDSYLIIPPFMDSFIARGYCHQGCLSEALGDEEIRVFAIYQHTHGLGRAIRTRIIRNGVELPPLVEEKNFDSAFQEKRTLKEERVIKKGDALITECYYDSSKRTVLTFGGLESTHEMCFASLFYYPRKALASCNTRLKYNSWKHLHPRKALDTIHKMDWTKKENRDKFVKDVETSDIINVCIGLKHVFDFHHSITPQLNVTVPYTPVDPCKK